MERSQLGERRKENRVGKRKKVGGRDQVRSTLDLVGLRGQPGQQNGTYEVSEE